MSESKPLELVVYPPVPPEPDDLWAGTGAEGLGHAMWRADRAWERTLGEMKHLTDAECAAQFYGHEYTRLAKLKDGEGSTDDHLMWAAQGRALWRMATTDHYDEDNDEEGLT